jgi:hypothetical protein
MLALQANKGEIAKTEHKGRFSNQIQQPVNASESISLTEQK